MTADRRDSPPNHTGRVAADGGAETPIDPAILDSVATDENVPREDFVDALAVLDASLTGQHSTDEEEYDSVTAEGVRAYVVDTRAWETLRTEHDIDSRLAAAAQHDTPSRPSRCSLKPLTTRPTNARTRPSARASSSASTPPNDELRNG